MEHPKHPVNRPHSKPQTVHPTVKRTTKSLRPINELASLTAVASLSRKFFNVALF